MAAEIPIGERVRFYREAQRRKLTVVAGLAGISVDYLGQIERGVKTPTIPLLHAIARVLGVPTSALLGEAACEEGGAGHPVASAVQQVLVSYGSSGGAGASVDAPAPDPDLVGLRERVETAWRLWQSEPARYTTVGALLPELIREVEQAARGFRGDDEAERRRDAHRIAADLYFLLRTFCKRIGRVDLSLLVADRAVRAAEDADDPLRVAAAKWNVGHVLLVYDQAEGAEEVAVKTAEELEPQLADAEPQFTALYGALYLVAAMGAARGGDRWTARKWLRDKAQLAGERVGEGNVLWTVFGPTNVGLHAVSLEMEAGEAAEALRLADQVDVAQSPSIERRATFRLELARCHDQRREDQAVLLHLLGAEREAPEDMRYNMLARDLVRGLVKRARPSYAGEARELASRIGLFAS